MEEMTLQEQYDYLMKQAEMANQSASLLLDQINPDMPAEQRIETEAIVNGIIAQSEYLIKVLQDMEEEL